MRATLLIIGLCRNNLCHIGTYDPPHNITGHHIALHPVHFHFFGLAHAYSPHNNEVGPISKTQCSRFLLILR